MLVGTLQCWQSTSLGRRHVLRYVFSALLLLHFRMLKILFLLFLLMFFPSLILLCLVCLFIYYYFYIVLYFFLSLSLLLTRGISHDTVIVVLPPDFNANPPIRLIRVREIPLLILVKAADLGTCPPIGSQSEGTLSHKFSLGISKGKGICHPMYSKLGGYFFSVPGKAEMPRGEPIPRHETTLL